FIDTGLIQHVFMSFPLESIHPNAVRASEAAECAAAQGRFWEMHGRLFEQAGALGAVEIGRLAEGLGLDAEAFLRCTGGEAAARVANDRDEGKRLGVRGTPTFFIGTVDDDGSI